MRSNQGNCNNQRPIVNVGDAVKTGDVLAVVGQTGNAAGTWTHCHFEVRAKASSRGLDPTAYAGIPNTAGTYGNEPETELPSASTSKLQMITVGPVSQGDADAIFAVCKERGLTDAGLYKSEWAEV